MDHGAKRGTAHVVYIVVIGWRVVSSGAILPITRPTVPKAQSRSAV